MTPLRRTSRLAEESGFTLIEALVATVTSGVVAVALFAIIQVSLNQTSSVAERVSANQRGRVAMEYILNELHSSCVAVSAVPIKEKSNAESLRFLSQSGTQAFFTSMNEHRIYLSGSTLYDATYPSNGGVAPKWTFSETPSKTVTLLTGVAKSGSTPLFRYYKYEGSTLPETELTVPLEKTTAQQAAQVKIAFTVEPEKKENTLKPSKALELSDTVLLRFDPASTTSQNTPCT